MKFIIILCTLFIISAADVSELSSNKYLPPGSEQQASSISSRQDAGPSDDSVVVTAEESAVATSSDDGGAAPAPEAAPEAAPSVRIGDTPSASAPEPEPAHELKDDGYQYKTVRRIRYRYRT